MTAGCQERARSFLSAIARRHVHADAHGTSAAVHESVSAAYSMKDLADGGLPSPDNVLSFVDQQLARVPNEQIADPEAFARAKVILLREARRSLTKVRTQGGGATFSARDVGAFEAVIEVDGSRPSLLLQGGRVDRHHPFAEAWAEDIGSTEETIARVAAAVGRIEPVRGSPGRYFGTGFVIDSARGLVLTNRHVLESMYRGLREFIDLRSGHMTFADGAFIDFDGEVNTLGSKRYRVMAATYVGPDDGEFGRLDAALLRIRPLDVRERALDPHAPTDLPPAVGLSPEIAGATGARGSFAVIGFPGKVPARQTDASVDVDWEWITRTLMGGYQGVKRLAPGAIDEPLGQLASDPRRWCFGHDATTLQGSSGSACVLWKDPEENVFGLHFSGRTLHVNYAHALARIRDHLDAARAVLG